MVFYAKDLFLNILLSKSIFYCLKKFEHDGKYSDDRRKSAWYQKLASNVAINWKMSWWVIKD